MAAMYTAFINQGIWYYQDYRHKYSGREMLEEFERGVWIPSPSPPNGWIPFCPPLGVVEDEGGTGRTALDGHHAAKTGTAQRMVRPTRRKKNSLACSLYPGLPDPWWLCCLEVPAGEVGLNSI